MRSSDEKFRRVPVSVARPATDANAEEASVVCSHMQQQLLASMTAHGWPITFSAGAVSFTMPPQSADEAISIADTLMYEVKARGKNHIEHFTWTAASKRR